jgi:hypothetical protein
MTQNSEDSGARTIARPIAIVVVIADPEQDNTVADEGRRLLDADEVVSAENGTVNNKTNMAEATEDTQ